MPLFHKKPKPPLDFVVEFSDGRVFTSKDGTWNEVCGECKISRLTIGGSEVLEGFERYAFSWEAEARATVGMGGGVKRADRYGTVVALIAIGVTGDKARIVRVPRDPSAPIINQDHPANRIAFPPDSKVWRPGLVPVAT